MNIRTVSLLIVLNLVFVYCVYAQNSSPSQEPLTVEAAKQLLRKGFDLRGEKKFNEAIDVLEKVVQFDPKLEVSFPDEGIQLIQATWELAMAYYAQNNWEKALPLLEQCDRDMRMKYPDADLLSPTLIADCRKKLGMESRLDREPILIAWDKYVLYDCMPENGSLLVPASEAVSLLHLDAKADPASKSVTLSVQGDSPRSIKLTATEENALADGKSLSLPTAPVMRDNELMVPLRAVAEYFGCKVKWDPMPKVAWVQ